MYHQLNVRRLLLRVLRFRPFSIRTSYFSTLPTLVLSAMLLFAGGFLALYGVTRSRDSSTKNNALSSSIVTLTDDGFDPQRVVVQNGGTVTFTTARDQPFWPASNLHPSHSIFPAFDPKEPISPRASWSFTFTKPGKWEYHDHLDPYFRGTIEVLRAPNATVGSAETARIDTTCRDRGGAGENIQCWQEAIQQELQNNNLAAAFIALDRFTQQNPSQLASCHNLAHEIGEQAFRLFNQKRDFELSPKTSYCGYGFYHGFMETLVHTTNDMAQARTFCDYADRKLKVFIADAGGACIHGIGHGSVEDTPDPALWGDAQKIVAPALALCEQVARDQDERFRCTSGAFNALEIISDQGLYQLSANQKDPFWICREQPEKYKRACYTQFLVSAMQVARNDFSRAARFIDTIAEDAYATETLAGLAVERARAQDADFSATIEWCRSLKSRFPIPCISGFAEGFLKYGPPESEYVNAQKFCSSPLLSEKERAPCFDRILSLLRNFYTAEISRTICLTIDKKYQWQNCRYE